MLSDLLLCRDKILEPGGALVLEAETKMTLNRESGGGVGGGKQLQVSWVCLTWPGVHIPPGWNLQGKQSRSVVLKLWTGPQGLRSGIYITNGSKIIIIK